MGRRYLHALQVVAVGLFIGLLLSFYILLVPLLGQRIAQAPVSTLYSIAAVALVYLYVVCVVADNGDCGVKKREEELRQAYEKMCSTTPIVGGPPPPSFNYESDPLFPSKEDPKIHELSSPFSEAYGYTTLSLGEDPNVTVCFLCNKKVLRSSKHCRSCDKCVMGFDHHCRWLNNCVGKKNYNYFVALMAACLSLLLMEGGVGVMVITQCFTQGDMMALRIHQKLGLSTGCFISLAVLISVASFSASAAVGELLLFHMLLIKKGLSTYEFVLASKELNVEHIDVDDNGLNQKGDSSLVASNFLLCRRRGSFFYGGWCTTHRVFLDPEYQQDDTMHIAHQKMSSADFSEEIAPVTFKAKAKPRQKPVKVNIWHLMRLNAHEARRALERRSSSSFSSSSPYTRQSTTEKSSTSFNNKNKVDLQPLPVEARCGFRDQFHSILPFSTTQMRSIIEEEEEEEGHSSSSSLSTYFDSDNYYSEEVEEGSDRGLRQQQQQLSKDSSSTPIDKILINDSSIFFSGPLTVEREGDLFH